jgi:hypothetical protein
MMDWQREIEIELLRAGNSQNPGRLRTSARRIAGIAVQELQKRDVHVPAELGYVNALRKFIKSENLPLAVSAAAARLESRLSPDFTSQSLDPVGDAMIIVEFVRKQLLSSKENRTGLHDRD